MPKEIHVVFHNGSNYDYHFIIKELGEGFEGQLVCLGENTEKYITFSATIKKENENGKTKTYTKKSKVMSCSLSNLKNSIKAYAKTEIWF